jgi:hypothetical protein
MDFLHLATRLGAYAPEKVSVIPINEGPWKLYGLPGLIFAAKTTDVSILFQFAFFCLSAQTKIKGFVLDVQTRKPIVSATVTMHPVGSPSILAYTMTSEDGTLSLKRSGLPDSVLLLLHYLRRLKTAVPDAFIFI